MSEVLKCRCRRIPRTWKGTPLCVVCWIRKNHKYPRVLDLGPVVVLPAVEDLGPMAVHPSPSEMTRTHVPGHSPGCTCRMCDPASSVAAGRRDRR